MAARGARLALGGWIGGQGIMFGAYVVLAHLVAPKGFGMFVAGSLLVNFGLLFAESGMMSALINRRDRIDEAASNAFFSLLLSGGLMAGLALATSPLIGLYFKSDRIAQIAAVMSGWLFLRAVTIVPDALLQRRLSFVRRAVVDPLGAVVFAATSIIACSQGAGVWGLVIGTYASEVLEVATTWYFARFRPRWEHRSLATWRELSAFARPVLQSEILRRVASQLDVIMLGRFSGAAVLGEYRNGFRLAQQPAAAFVDVGAHVLLPVLARLADQRERMVTGVKRVFGLAAAISVPISLASIPLGVPIAVLSLGARWRGAGHAIACLWGLLLGGAISAVAAESIKAVGRPDLLIRLHGFGLAVSAITIGSAAIPFGLLGVATAVSVSQCLVALYAYALLVPIMALRWKDLAQEMAAPLIASGAMVAAMIAFAAAVHPLGHGEGRGILLSLVQVTVGGLVYLLLLVAIDRRRWHDLKRLTGGLRARGR